MQLTSDPVNDPASAVVAQTEENCARFSARLLHLFSFVPDDKLGWTPAPTARSPLRLVAHCAEINRFFAHVITGSLPASLSSPEAFFTALHDAEAKITTREGAIASVQETTTELCRVLGTVNAANVDAPAGSPFGPLPVRFWVDQSSEHLAIHVGQMAYLQTIWGDLDNHLG